MSTRNIAIAVVAILLLIGTVWAVVRNRPDPQVEKIKQLQAEAFKEGTTPEQRRQSFELVHKEMEQLSPEKRHEVGHQMRENFERRMDEQIMAYFAMPQAQRVAYLDQQIKEMEQRRKEMEARRAKEGQSPPRANAGGQQAGPGGQPANASGQQAGPGGQRPPRDNSTEARMQRRDQRLDRSSAAQRALRSTYFADMQQRRLQLGLPASPGPGRGPGR